MNIRESLEDILRDIFDVPYPLILRDEITMEELHGKNASIFDQELDTCALVTSIEAVYDVNISDEDPYFGILDNINVGITIKQIQERIEELIRSRPSKG